MPAEISIPFRVAPDGGIAFEVDPDVQIGQHVRALVGTEPGERVMLPDYGASLNEFLFNADDETVEEQITDQVSEGLALYEPGVMVYNVAPIPTAEGDGIAEVEVAYTRTDASTTNASLARNVNTAVIGIGGQVQEIIRG